MERAQLIAEYRERIAEEKKIKLKSTELDFLIEYFIEALAKKKNKREIVSLCREEIALLEEGYPQTTVAKNQLPKYRKAITTAIEENSIPLTTATTEAVSYQVDGEEIAERQHRAYGLMKYSKEFYEAERGVAAKKNNEQQDRRKPIYPQALIEIAVECIKSRSPYQVAAGLALLTGRRLSEILIKGKFKATAHPYAVEFYGQQKKGVNPPPFVIPVLLPASELIEAIDRFRQFTTIENLKELSAHEAESQTHEKINRQVRKQFEDVLPVIEGRERLSVHSLRGAYAAIATQRLRPSQQTPQRFAQAILGHSIGEEQVAQKNSSATEHYNRYYTVDQKGHPTNFDPYITERYGAIPALSPEVETANISVINEEEEDSKLKSVAVAPDDLIELMTQQSLAIAQLAQSVSELKAGNSRLHKENEIIENEQDAAFVALASKNKKLESELEALRIQNQELKAQQAKLAQIQKVLGGETVIDKDQTEPPPPQDQEPPNDIKPSKAPVQDGKSKEKQPSHSQASQRLERILPMFRDFNAGKDFGETIAITQSIFSSIGVSRPAIKAFMEEHQQDIEELNNQAGITSSRHNKGKDVDGFVNYVKERESEIDNQ